MKFFIETNLFVFFFAAVTLLSGTGCGHSTSSTKPSDNTIHYDPPLKLYVKESSINIRSGPGKEHEIIGTAKKGQLITAHCKMQDWYCIHVNGSEDGYIYQHLLSSEKPKLESATAPAKQAPTLDDPGLMAFPPRSPSAAPTGDSTVPKKPSTATTQPPPAEPGKDVDLFGPKDATSK